MNQQICRNKQDSYYLFIYKKQTIWILLFVCMNVCVYESNKWKEEYNKRIKFKYELIKEIAN